MFLDGDKIYTSYFNNSVFRDKIDLIENERVSIALFNFKFPGKTIDSLCPPREYFRLYKEGVISKQDLFYKYYYYKLKELDPNEVFNNLRGKILCCHEKDYKDCHRSIFLHWMILKGYKVLELPTNMEDLKDGKYIEW